MDGMTKPQVEFPAASRQQICRSTTSSWARAWRPRPGATVDVHYVGVEFDSGEEFDASYNRGASIEFPLRGLIQGWQDGIPGMRVGGRRQLIVRRRKRTDPRVAGIACPGKTLVFVIDLLARCADVVRGARGAEWRASCAQTPTLMQVLTIIRDLELPDGLLMSGAVYQPVWNNITRARSRVRAEGLRRRLFRPRHLLRREDLVIPAGGRRVPGRPSDLGRGAQTRLASTSGSRSISASRTSRTHR